MKKIDVILAMVAVLLAGCGAPQKPVENTAPNVTPIACVHPESDNSYSWSYNSCVDVSKQVYSITVQVADEIVNHTETNASGSGSGFVSGGVGFASSSWRMWQDGKGILPTKVIAMSPEFQGVAVGDYILLKTSDLKAMALPNGAQAQFICNQDVEILSPVENGQVLTTDRLTYELDDCRMVSPEFVPVQP